MGYNKKVLSKATSELGKAKKPSTPRDKVVDSKGYWNPDNQDKSVVRVPGNSITMGPNPETGEPIPFPIYGIPNVGMPQMMYPGNDYSFSGADYVDEYLVAKKGGSLPSLPKKANSKKYSRSLTATNKLFAQNPLTKKSKSKKNKIFDPNAKYYQDGGESVCLDDGRCFETDEEQKLLDLEADLRRKAVDTAGAAFELTGDAGDARKAFKKLGMKKSLGERLPGVENPYTCMYYAGMPYCINEGVDPKYFESNDKFIKAQAQGKIPFTQIAETYDPNFEQNLNIPTGSIVSLEKPTGMKHAMLSFKHPETGESSYFQSTGEESDWDIRNQVFYRPSENHPARIYQYTPFATEREKLAEQARTNPTYYNTKLQTRPAQPLELDLTPEEIEEYRRGGYIVEDISVPSLTKAQEGIVTEPELTYEAPETFAYANKEAEKKHKLLMDKARALMTTAQGRKLWYNELKPKDFTVKELSRFVKGVGDYNKEAQAYQKAKRRMEEDKISTDTFAQLYNQRGWAKFDPNTMQEGYEGQFQDAVNEANRRKEKNMAVTDLALELTGAPALQRIASDPVGTLKGVGTTALDLTAAASPLSYINPTQPNVNPLTGEQYWSGLDETLDVAGVAPFFGAAGRLLKGSKFLKNVKPGANTFDIPEQSFKKELYNAYNPETKSYDVYEIDVPQEIIPGRSYADVQHKMKNLRKDLGIGPVEHLMNKTFGRKPVGLAKDSGIVVDPETGQLFDSNTRYWLNREYGNLPKAEEVINKQYLAKNYGKPVASNLSFEDAQKILETPSDKKFTSDFEEATFLKPEESYFQPRTEFERELSSEAERYYTLATSPENIERARMLDQEFGTNYTKALQEMIFQRQNKPVADKYPFNIRVLENPGEGAGGYTSLTPEGAAKKAAGIPTTINDREVVIFSDSPVKDLKRRVPHELSHHKTLSQNNVKALENAWGDKLKNAIDNPGEISKTNPVLANKLMQPAFKDMPDSPTLYEYLSDPAEVDAYLNTNFRDQLVQKGILKNHWDELTDNKLALYFMDEGPKDNMVNVLLDIVKPSEFLEIFNKGIYAIPAAIGTGAMLGSQGNEQTYQEGGIFIDIDNEDDIQRYIDQGYIVEFDEGGFVPSNTIKFATPTPKKLPNKPIEKKEDTPASTTGFMNAELKFAKPVTQRKVSQAPAEEPYVPPIGQFKYSGTPVSKAPAQPIPGGFGSMISNTGKPGVINQALLKEQEAKASKLNKAAGKMKEIEMPSIWERVMLNQSQAFSQGPDVYKATEEFKNYPQYLKRIAAKEGLIDVEEAKVDLKKVAKKQPKINPEKNKVDEFYQELNAVPDSYSPSDSLISYRNQWDNKKGFEYIATPVKKDRSPDDTYKGVKGVGHFLLDASANPSKPYSHTYNKAYIEKAKQNNEWIPTFQPVKGSEDRVRLKYKKPNEITKEDQIYTPLRQMKFSDIRFDKTKRPEGFQSGIKEVTKNDGQGTYLIFKDRDGYSRFSGGSVVFIFKDKNNNTVVRDFAGSLNQIEWEGLQIQKQYGIKPDQLTIGYHDVGSFSAKPKANAKGELKASQWAGYNPYGWTGGALLIPKK